jgi:hypothetical protein
MDPHYDDLSKRKGLENEEVSWMEAVRGFRVERIPYMGREIMVIINGNIFLTGSYTRLERRVKKDL